MEEKSWKMYIVCWEFEPLTYCCLICVINVNPLEVVLKFFCCFVQRGSNSGVSDYANIEDIRKSINAQNARPADATDGKTPFGVSTLAQLTLSHLIMVCVVLKISGAI